MAIDENRPPYVVFEMQAVEDRAQTIAQGFFCEKEIAMAVITRPGSADSMVKEAEIWLKELKEKSRMGAVPPTWYPAFQASYDNWKKGESGEIINGIPIKGWASIGNAQQRLLVNIGILSVEDLATLPDADVSRVGTGGIALKQKAQAYLDAINGPGKQAEKQVAQQKQIDDLVELNRKLAKEVADLKAAMPAKEKF